MFAYYVLNYANADTFGASSFPSNPFNISQDYGRAGYDIRNRFFLGGSIGLPWGLRLSPFMLASSGSPYNITLSQDLIGSAQFNQRPSFAAASSTCPAAFPQCIVTVPGFGTFDTIPQPGSKLVPINSLTGPSRFTLNLRLAKTFGFGPETKGQGAAPEAAVEDVAAVVVAEAAGAEVRTRLAALARAAGEAAGAQRSATASP